MFKILQCTSGLLRIKSETFVVARRPHHLIMYTLPLPHWSPATWLPLRSWKRLPFLFENFSLLFPLPGKRHRSPDVYMTDSFCHWGSAQTSPLQRGLLWPFQTKSVPLCFYSMSQDVPHIVHSTCYCLKLFCLLIYWLYLPPGCMFQKNRDLFCHVHHFNSSA